MYPIGRSIEEIETPALLLDLDKFQRNIDKMFFFAKKVGVSVRPHAKTFKAAAICNKLLEAGAIGLMTQKLGEAEAILNSGVLYGNKDILIGQEIAEPTKAETLVGMNVAMGEGKVIASLDNAKQAEILSDVALKWETKQHVVIDLDHTGKCGTRPGKPTLDLAKKVVSLKGLRFRGIYGYEAPVDKEIALQKNKLTVDTANLIRSAGIEVEIVSAGSTLTYEVTGTYPGITEIQPGSFVFGAGPEGSGYGWETKNDVYFESALTVLTQIISDNFSDRVITDAGEKAMAPMRDVKPPVLVKIDEEVVGCESVSFAEEHGIVRFKEGSEVRKRLKFGQKIEFIPSHCCTCVNQHDEIFVVRNKKLAVCLADYCQRQILLRDR